MIKVKHEHKLLLMDKEMWQQWFNKEFNDEEAENNILGLVPLTLDGLQKIRCMTCKSALMALDY